MVGNIDGGVNASKVEWQCELTAKGDVTTVSKVTTSGSVVQVTTVSLREAKAI